jgi:tetratricopeptide (TPR) repeat protein
MNKTESLIQVLKYIIITALVVIAYLPTFSGEFILDDNPLIKNNFFIKNLHPISSYLIQEDGIVDRKDMGSFHSGYYRPLINLTYSIDYKLWGMNAPGFRTTNLILHLFCCFFLFKLIVLILKDQQPAFWITLLFALHPINTESVSWVISRNNIMVTLFILLSFYYYIIWWEKNNYIAWIVSIMAFFCALFSKEFGIMLLPIFFLYHRVLYREKQDLFKELSSYLPFIGALILYFFLRKNVTGAFLTPFDMTKLLSSTYFVPYLILWNMKLIFFPSNLHFIYMDYPSSMIQWQAVLSIVLFLFLVIFIWIYRKNKILLFAILSFMFFIFPVLNIIPSASSLITLVAMRWLYLPMAFVCIGMASIIGKAMVRWKTITISTLIVLISYFGLYTHILNKNLWHDEEVFFQQEVLGFKNDFFAADFAEKLFENGNYQEAEKYFRIALDRYPFQVYHYINYSALLIETGRPEIAIKILQEAKSFSMTSHSRGEWHNNMGMALSRSDNESEGLRHFKKAVIFASDEPQFWANLGNAYGLMGDLKDCLDVLEKGMKIIPDSVMIRINLAKTYINLKEYEKAILLLEEISVIDKKDIDDISGMLNLARERLRNNHP